MGSGETGQLSMKEAVSEEKLLFLSRQSRKAVFSLVNTEEDLLASV